MQILSQSRDEIVNVNNLINIFIENDYIKIQNEAIEGSSIVALSDNERIKIVLGFFENKERAKEILQEIINVYKNGIIRVQIENCKWVEENPIYEIPKR